MIFIMLVIVENHESVVVVVNTNDGTSNRKMPRILVKIGEESCANISE